MYSFKDEHKTHGRNGDDIELQSIMPVANLVEEHEGQSLVAEVVLGMDVSTFAAPLIFAFKS